MKYLVNGVEFEFPASPDGVEVSRLSDRLIVRTPDGTATAVAVREGEKTWISYQGRVYEIERADAYRTKGGGTKSGELRASMPGQIVDVLVGQGDTVTSGQKLVVLEAMKTQQPIVAPFDGTITTIGVEKGQQVTDGQLLVLVSLAN